MHHSCIHIHTCTCTCVCVVGSSPTRGSSFFLGKVTALGVLCCFALFVCLTLLASFFLPSHLSFKNMYIHPYMNNHVHRATILDVERKKKEVAKSKERRKEIYTFMNY